MPTLLQRSWTWLLPPWRNRSAPWSGLEIFVVLVLTQWFWFALVGTLLRQADFFGWVYGPEFAQHLAEAKDSPERNAELLRMNVWVTVLCLPLNFASVVTVSVLLSGALPYQLGLTTHRLGRNVLAGVLGTVLVAPLHILIQYLNTLFMFVLHVPPTKHPLQVIGEQALPVDRVLILISALVAAPLMEELVFRGFLQPWLVRRRAGGALAVIFALGLALVLPRDQLDAAWANGDWRGLAVALQPAAFVLMLAPVLLLTRRMTRPEAAGGIFGTAVLFAAAHSSIWPSPIPLLPLGIVLGWLAYRTKSIVGPIVLHALFNLIACVEILFAISR